jgi:hypothetical protein
MPFLHERLLALRHGRPLLGSQQFLLNLVRLRVRVQQPVPALQAFPVKTRMPSLGLLLRCTGRAYY